MLTYVCLFKFDHHLQNWFILYPNDMLRNIKQWGQMVAFDVFLLCEHESQLLWSPLFLQAIHVPKLQFYKLWVETFQNSLIYFLKSILCSTLGAYVYRIRVLLSCCYFPSGFFDGISLTSFGSSSWILGRDYVNGAVLVRF